MDNIEFKPHFLPLEIEVESKNVLKKTIEARAALSALNQIAKTIPNQNILINSLTIQEAKDSSEIENIITTHDELYRSEFDVSNITQATKEVKNYRNALMLGKNLLQKNNLLLLKDIVAIQKELEQNDAGLRKISGTIVKNIQTNEIRLKPLQKYDDIVKHLDNFIAYMNDDSIDNVGPLVKMAILHFTFEAIHPFYDGNGRTGRIINLLYLVQKGLLDLPILYLSGYIVKHKSDYYRLLHEVQTKENWEEFILFMLDGVEVTAKNTIELIDKIAFLMKETKRTIRDEFPKIYSKDLIEAIFYNPYVKIEFLEDYLKIHRTTASKYLNNLEQMKILQCIKIGRSKYFVNIKLYDLLKKERMY